MKRKQKQKRPVLHLRFQQELSALGYRADRRMVLKACLILSATVLGVGLLYRLKLPCLAVLLFVTALCIPYHIYHAYQNQYDGEVWRLRLDYMEQMLSSFKRRPKMLTALKDTQTVFEKSQDKGSQRMAEAIRAAMSVIQAGDPGTERSIYRNAGSKIEAEYGCHRLTTLHNFMEKVEQQGGEYKRAADLLLQEHAVWKTNVETLRKEQNTKRVGVRAVTVACTAICAFPAYLNTLLAGFTDSPLYQACSTGFLLTILIFYLVAENKLKGWWSFESSVEEEEKVLRNYRAWQTYDRKKQKRKMALYALLPFGIAVAGLLGKNYLIAAIGAGYGLLLLQFADSRRRALKRSVVKALEYQYPQWMMEMTLLLQTENVYVSLKRSALQAPAVIREEIAKLSKRLEQEPNRVEPYNEFFGDLGLDFIKTSMRNLYSISSLGVQEETALLQLIAHNNVLMNQAEELRGKAKLNLWTAYLYLPMVSGGAKIIADTLLLCATMITSAVQSV